LQQKWEQGNFAFNATIVKPGPSIQFGNACQYTSESKAVFTGQKTGNELGHVGSDIKRKFLQNNVKFQGANREDVMKTVAMVIDGAKNQDMQRQLSQSVKQVSTTELSRQMRAANFKMGSILPEHDRVKSIELSKPGEGSFRPNAKSIIAGSALIHSDKIKAQGVSEGNPLLMKGKADFVTNNMQQIKWIQPTPVSL